MKKEIWTIGHSTKPFDEFLELLQVNDIKTLADVRRYPGSRKYPQFNQETLKVDLGKHGIIYQHFPGLGGRRKARRDSVNTAWRNEAFKGYADHMGSEEFQKGLLSLIETAGKMPTAMMCSEVLWWRCHRALISDLLKSKGFTVNHIMSATKVQEHPYTGAASIVEGALSYGA